MWYSPKRPLLEEFIPDIVRYLVWTDFDRPNPVFQSDMTFEAKMARNLLIRGDSAGLLETSSCEFTNLLTTVCMIGINPCLESRLCNTHRVQTPLLLTLTLRSVIESVRVLNIRPASVNRSVLDRPDNAGCGDQNQEGNKQTCNVFHRVGIGIELVLFRALPYALLIPNILSQFNPFVNHTTHHKDHNNKSKKPLPSSTKTYKHLQLVL